MFEPRHLHAIYLPRLLGALLLLAGVLLLKYAGGVERRCLAAVQRQSECMRSGPLDEKLTNPY